LPLYDSQLMPGLVRKIAVVLEDAQNDPELLAALARGSRRPDLVAEPQRDRMLAHLMSFEGMGDLNSLLAQTLLAYDTYGPNGPEESDATIRVLTALSLSLEEASVDADPGRFGVRLVRVLSTEDPAFRPSGEYTPMLSVQVDHRGLPL